VTDVDVFAMPQKHIEAQKATNSWRKVTSSKEGRDLIAQAEAEVKKASKKSKSLGQQMTAIRSPNDAINPNIKTPSDTWIERPGHLQTYGKNASNPTPMRVSE
jgi:hypothetical protein